MNAYWWTTALNYILALIAVIIAASANRKINDHYEHDHINNEMESE